MSCVSTIQNHPGLPVCSLVACPLPCLNAYTCYYANVQNSISQLHFFIGSSLSVFSTTGQIRVLCSCCGNCLSSCCKLPLPPPLETMKAFDLFDAALQVTAVMAVVSSVFLPSKCILVNGKKEHFCVNPMDIVFVSVIILLLVPQVFVVSQIVCQGGFPGAQQTPGVRCSAHTLYPFLSASLPESSSYGILTSYTHFQRN